MRKTWIVGFLFGGLSCCAAASAYAADQAGEVLTLRGDCFVTSGGKRMALTTGSPVYVADAIEVSDAGKLKLRMIDGSVISAASGSKLTIEAYSTSDSGQKRDAEVNLASGLLRAVVSKVSESSRFEVDTAAGVAAVRGTDWFVEASSGQTRVGVLQGQVGLTSSATHHGVEVPARWGSRLEAGKDPVPPRLWQKSEFADVIARTDLD